jgi:uncharacterized protein
MMIGIISDLHGYPEKFKKSLQHLKNCDVILCAGDVLYHGPRNPILAGYNPEGLIKEIQECSIPILFARGNCDSEVDQMVLNDFVIEPYIFYEKDGVRFVVLHGHNTEQEKLKEIARRYKADVVITGHTHIRTMEVYENTLLVNPGSISVPKGDGIPTVAVYNDNKVKFINIENGNVL